MRSFSRGSHPWLGYVTLSGFLAERFVGMKRKRRTHPLGHPSRVYKIILNNKWLRITICPYKTQIHTSVRDPGCCPGGKREDVHIRPVREKGTRIELITHHHKQKRTPSSVLYSSVLPTEKYRRRDLNPHEHFCSKDFKSFVSTIPPLRHP